MSNGSSVTKRSFRAYVLRGKRRFVPNPSGPGVRRPGNSCAIGVGLRGASTPPAVMVGDGYGNRVAGLRPKLYPGPGPTGASVPALDRQLRRIEVIPITERAYRGEERELLQSVERDIRRRGLNGRLWVFGGKRNVRMNHRALGQDRSKLPGRPAKIQWKKGPGSKRYKCAAGEAKVQLSVRTLLERRERRAVLAWEGKRIAWEIRINAQERE